MVHVLAAVIVGMLRNHKSKNHHDNSITGESCYRTIGASSNNGHTHNMSTTLVVE